MQRLLNRTCAFARRDDGIAAVEFAVLAPVFFAVMSAVFEVTWFAYSTTSIQRAVEDAIDSVRTGHVYSTMNANDWDAEQWYRETICAKIDIPDCLDDLEVRVQSFDKEFDLARDSEVSGSIDVGASNTLMRVEATIEIPKLFATGVIFGEEALTATAGLTFMTEPY